MEHYDSCYDADATEAGKKKHQKIKKDLIDLVNKLDDDDRELIIGVIKNLEVAKSMMSFLKKMTK